MPQNTYLTWPAAVGVIVPNITSVTASTSALNSEGVFPKIHFAVPRLLILNRFESTHAV